jgi:hypothetical protein
MTRKHIIAYLLIVLAIYLAFVFYTNRNQTQKVSYDPIPSIGMNEEYEEYSKTFKTYESKLGYSFKYPSHLYVMEDPELIGTPERLYILPASPESKGGIYGVVISIGVNDENMSPVEWLKGPDSGADLSDGYNVFDIDGQEAVSVDGGTWVVVNTPDNKYRLSIALLPGENGTLLFTEEGIIISSLKFVK